jgi:hypothetical protein
MENMEKMDNKVTYQKSKRVYLQCPYLDCRYKWYYAGRFSFYATCPSCHRNVKISKNKILLQSVEVGHHSQIAAVENSSAQELINKRQ